MPFGLGRKIDDGPKKKPKRPLTPAETDALTKLRREQRLGRKQRLEEKRQREKDERRQKNLQWLQVNRPEEYAACVLAEFGVSSRDRDGFGQIKSVLKEARELQRLLGGGSGKVDNAVLDVVRDVAGQLAPAVPALAQALASRQHAPAQPAAPPSQPQSAPQESPMPQGDPRIARLVQILAEQIEPPGKPRATPKAGAEALVKFAGLGQLEQQLLGKAYGIPPADVSEYCRFVGLVINDFRKTSATEAGLVGYVQACHEVNPLFDPVWGWFGSDQERVDWLVAVMAILQGAHPAQPVPPAEGI